MNKKTIPVFFATDNNYAPILAVALKSILENSSKEHFYKIYVLTTSLSDNYEERLAKLVSEYSDYASIEFTSLKEEMEKSQGNFHLRDYYQKETYCRIFIPRLFPQYDKVLYLDCDITVLGDISELYNIDVEDNLVAAVHEDIVNPLPNFQEYIDKNLGLDHDKYFSAGVLLINAKKYRDEEIEKKFIDLLNKYTFRIVQDEDYLNVLCFGQTKIIDQGWNKSPIPTPGFDDKDLKLIHFKINGKPWHFPNTKYEEHFWKFAEQTAFLPEIKGYLDSYTDKDREQAEADFVRLLKWVDEDVADPLSYAKTKHLPIERVRVLRKIRDFEKEGKFDIDVEDDIPGRTLMPNEVDYLRYGFFAKWKARKAIELARKFVNGLIKNNQFIIKEIKGTENIEGLESGAIMTCNHFNPFDSFAAHLAFEAGFDKKKKRFYRVISEANYTTYPGFYGYLMKNADTLPLSSNKDTIHKFMTSLDRILRDGHIILVYPEQSMWWNYKKPRPMKEGAFRFALKSEVPVVPVFITMKDSEYTDGDGFPVQEYTVHIEKPIYADSSKSRKENIEYLMNENYKVWKEIYEREYGIPLTYLCDEK